jgi:antitoxin HicB
MNRHIGRNFDDFLEDEGMLAETEEIAWKRVIAFQIAKLMAEQNISKTAMAEQMQTSRAAVDRLLDENNGAATLQTLEKAAIVLGKRLRIELV